MLLSSVQSPTDSFCIWSLGWCWVLDEINANFALNSSQKSVCKDSTPAALLAGDSAEFQFPACYRMCLIPGKLFFLHLARVRVLNCPGGESKVVAAANEFLHFLSGVRHGLGHLLFLTTQKTPDPVTYCCSCVDRGVWQLKPSNPSTAGAVWCNPVQSHPAPSCSAFSLLKGLFRKGLRRSSHKYCSSLCTCLNVVQDS